jgi:hypothetical protein
MVFVVCLLELLNTPADKNPRQPDKIKFLKVMAVGCAIYLSFMVTVDVPMYWNRWKEDTAAHKIYDSFLDGLTDTFECQRVTQEDSFWVEEMPWITGYFTFGVWFTLWLINVRL